MFLFVFFFEGGKGEVYDAKKQTQIYKYIHTCGISMNLIISKMNWTEIPMEETFRVYPGANGKVVVSFASFGLFSVILGTWKMLDALV